MIPFIANLDDHCHFDIFILQLPCIYVWIDDDDDDDDDGKEGGAGCEGHMRPKGGERDSGAL